MNRKAPILIALVLAIVILAGAFLLLSFRLMHSDDRTSSNVTSSRSNSSVPAPVPLKVYLWVEEKDRLSVGFRDDLLAALNATGKVQASLLPTPKPGPQDFPILRVWIARPGLSWTPVYGQSDMLVRFAFSTFSIDVPQIEESPIVMNAPPGTYSLFAQGNVNIRDTSFGLFSLPGYWDYMAQAAAKPVADEVIKTIQ